MKAFITIVTTAVILGCAQAQLPAIGQCSFTNYTLGARACNTKFIQDMIKNPKSDCSAELTALQGCVTKEIKVCVPGAGDAMIDGIVKSMITKPMMCDKAGIQYPGSMGVNTTLPCNITEQQYTKDINGCSKKTVDLWKSNRADPEICVEYKASKDCVRKILDTKCDFSSIVWFKELVQLSLGNYNPFCGSGVDPTTAPSTKQPDAQKSTPTAGSQAIPLKGLIVLFASAVALFVL